MKKFSLLAAAIATMLSGCASEPTVSSAPPPTGPIGGVIVASSGLSGGTATYTIHVPVPPGRDDTQPNFDVRYSSQDGDGLLGMGWGLDTPEAVFRCPATPAMDGYTAGVRFASTDRLCVDGDHLVVTSGNYGRPGATYQREVTNGSQVTQFGEFSSPESYFMVTHQSGSKDYFKAGFVPAGRSAPLSWYESRYVDDAGGTVDYSYDRSVPGEMLLTEIRYTGHEIAGVATPGTRFVRFSYEARPDTTSTFLAGGETRQTRRLAGIVVGMDGDKPGAPARESREFAFSYAPSPTTGRSLLTEVRECIVDADGSKQWLPKTSFTWNGERLAFKAPVAYGIPNPETDLQPQQLVDATAIMRSPYIAPGDFDGDGRRELLYYRPGVGAHLYFLKPDGTLRQDVDVSKFFKSPPEVLFHSAAADVDNDGASDLPGNVDGHLGFISWSGTGMGQPVTTDVPFSEQMALAYISGGRQPDVIQTEPISAGSADYGLYLYRNLGSRPGALHFGKRQLVYALKKSKATGRHEGFYEGGDLDGNGLADVFIMSGDRVSAVILPRQDADGTLHFDVAAPATLGMPDRALDDTYFADLNGDGLPDLVYADAAAGGARTWRYQINRGGRFDAPVDTQVADERNPKAGISSSFTTDVDNDGKDELLYPDKMVAAYCLGTSHKLQCADDPNGMDDPWDDLSIYQFAVLKFQQGADGSFKPVVMHDANIVAQANLVGSGDLQGDGLTDVFSPFSSWYGDGGFRGADGKRVPCPPVYGCGLHVSSNVSSGHADGANGAADFMSAAVDGLGYRVFWDYFPMSSTKSGLYSVVPVGKPERYVDPDDFYFTSSQYLVGAYGRSSGVGDGYQAFTYQYGDERYSAAGRGMRGFRYVIEHDLSSGYRRISLYDQRFPLDGRLLAEWKVDEHTLDDGLQKGVAPPDHRYAQTDTWDCTAPKGYSVGGVSCVDSGGPIFNYRMRHRLYHDYDKDLGEWTDVDSAYDYDQNSQESHRLTKTTSSKKIDTEEVTTHYLPVDPAHWYFNRLLRQETVKITDPVAGVKGAPEHSRTDEDDSYEYDAHGLLHKLVERGPEKYVETRVLTYQQDPAAPDYGLLSSAVITRAEKEDQQPDYLRNLRVAYDAEGYSQISVTSAGLDPETATHDPVTGDLLTKTKDGVSQTFKYDILGRVVHYERTEKGKDPIIWDAEYGRCLPKQCISNAVYFATEVVNKRIIGTTFFDKRGEKISSPKDSFIKDD
ncbi:MAG TPA: FG-GAP-like repeat-containing protein [Gammaproteobacteria bacterium]|jgi:hypothetical protein